MAPIWRLNKMKLYNKMIFIISTLIAFLAILQEAAIGFAEFWPGGEGGP